MVDPFLVLNLSDWKANTKIQFLLRSKKFSISEEAKLYVAQHGAKSSTMGLYEVLGTISKRLIFAADCFFEAAAPPASIKTFLIVQSQNGRENRIKKCIKKSI